MTTILIVDDEIVIKLILETTLRRQNYTVVTADNGAAALSFLAKNHVDLVVTDILMPEMDGFAFLQKLRAERGSGDLPVIVLTGAQAARWETQAEQLGVDAILTKPIGSAELLRAIEEALSSSASTESHQGRQPQLG